MSATLRISTLAVFLAISGLAVPGCVIVADDDATLTVDNQSDFVLVEILLAPFDADFGGNLAPRTGLAPGDAIEIGVNCDLYDLRLTDEDNFSCDVTSIDLCLDDNQAVVYSNNACDLFTAARQTGEAAGTPSTSYPRAKQPTEAKQAE